MELLKDLGIIGLVVVLIQSIMNFFLNRNFEKFKTQIEEEAKLTQNKLDEIKYKNSKLHDKQADVIESLYQKLVKLNRSIRVYTAIVKLVPIDEEEKRKEENQQLSDIENDFKVLLEYFESNKIYFQEAIITEIEQLIGIYNEKMHDYIFPKNLMKKGMQRNELNEEMTKAHEAANFIRTEIPKKLKVIEIEFRKILNVE